MNTSGLLQETQSIHDSMIRSSEGKDLQSIQSSTTPDPGYCIGK